MRNKYRAKLEMLRDPHIVALMRDIEHLDYTETRPQFDPVLHSKMKEAKRLNRPFDLMAEVEKREKALESKRAKLQTARQQKKKPPQVIHTESIEESKAQPTERRPQPVPLRSCLKPSSSDSQLKSCPPVKCNQEKHSMIKMPHARVQALLWPNGEPEYKPATENTSQIK